MSIFDREDFDSILRNVLAGEEEIPPMQLVGTETETLEEMSEAA